MRFLVFLALFVGSISSSAAREFYAVVSQKDHFREIDNDLVQDVFWGRKTFWSNGDRIMAAQLSFRTEVGNEFIQYILQGRPRQFQSFWRRKLFSGRGYPPRSFETENEIIQYVRRQKNGLGIVTGVHKYPDLLFFKIKKP